MKTGLYVVVDQGSPRMHFYGVPNRRNKMLFRIIKNSTIGTRPWEQLKPGVYVVGIDTKNASLNLTITSANK